MPAPDTGSHKYTRGVLGVLTGSEDYPGAALMSVRAAVNTGVGMVHFAGSDRLNFLMNLSVPEAVCFTGDPLEERVQAWALGSGISGEERLEAARSLLVSGLPAVVDAGAVALSAQLLAEGLKAQPQQILTPHAGELADFFTWISALAPHLLGDSQRAPSRSDIEADPARWAATAARISGATVLLKGGSTHIAGADGSLLLVEGNSPWLATAGSGDTLTGIAGALLAGYEADTLASREAKDYAELAATAVHLHGLAAELVHGGGGLQGPLPPTLVAAQLPAAVAHLLAGAGE